MMESKMESKLEHMADGFYWTPEHCDVVLYENGGWYVKDETGIFPDLDNPSKHTERLRIDRPVDAFGPLPGHRSDKPAVAAGSVVADDLSPAGEGVLPERYEDGEEAAWRLRHAWKLAREHLCTSELFSNLTLVDDDYEWIAENIAPPPQPDTPPDDEPHNPTVRAAVAPFLAVANLAGVMRLALRLAVNGNTEAADRLLYDAEMANFKRADEIEKEFLSARK